MNVVIDASAAYDLLTTARCADGIVGAEDLLAPDLIVSELLNARWKVQRLGHDVPALEVTIAMLERLRIVPALPFAAAATVLADSLDHPLYDCLYVAVAQSYRAKLVTRDERFARKLRSAGLSRILR